MLKTLVDAVKSHYAATELAFVRTAKGWMCKVKINGQWAEVGTRANLPELVAGMAKAFVPQ